MTALPVFVSFSQRVDARNLISLERPLKRALNVP
jgi:hypothetical protein